MAGWLLLALGAVHAAEPPARWTEGPLGPVGLAVLDAAPFPHGQRPYQDGTVLVFVPQGAGRGPQVDVLVHLHGFETVLGPTVAAHRLVEQVAGSGRDIVLIVPQGPLNARDNDFGKLMEPGGLAALVREALAVARRDGRVASPAIGRVVLSAHSGGYRAAARAITQGGLPVDELLLFDALYGELDAFRAYVLNGGALSSSHTDHGGTRGANLRLLAQLRAAGIAVDEDLGRRAGRVSIGPTPLDHVATLRDGALQAWLAAPAPPP